MRRHKHKRLSTLFKRHHYSNQSISVCVEKVLLRICNIACKIFSSSSELLFLKNVVVCHATAYVDFKMTKDEKKGAEQKETEAKISD